MSLFKSIKKMANPGTVFRAAIGGPAGAIATIGKTLAPKSKATDILATASPVAVMDINNAAIRNTAIAGYSIAAIAGGGIMAANAAAAAGVGTVGQGAAGMAGATAAKEGVEAGGTKLAELAAPGDWNSADYDSLGGVSPNADIAPVDTGGNYSIFDMAKNALPALKTLSGNGKTSALPAGSGSVAAVAGSPEAVRNRNIAIFALIGLLLVGTMALRK